MNLDLTPQEKLFREEVRSWLEDNIPREPQPHEGPEMRAFDLAWQKKQYEAGWAGIAWPKEYGGRGMSIVEQLIWYEESAKTKAPDVGVSFVGLYHGGPTLIAEASEEQKAFHLPRILRGETVWCQGFSEPASGSDLASLSCKGVIDGDEIVVTGSKIWTSYAHLADYQELLVRTEPDSQRHGGISWVICDMHAPGITVTPIPFVNGVHHFNQVFYDEVRIPIRNVVGELNGGWKVAMATLSFERGTAFTQSQVELAMMVDELIERAQTRTRPDGKPGFGDMELGRRLSMLRAETAALRAMTYAAVSRNLRREQPGPDGSLLKVQLTRLKLEAEAISFELLGPHQAIRSLVTDKYLHNFASGVGGGTDEIQKNIIAQRVLGLPRSY